MHVKYTSRIIDDYINYYGNRPFTTRDVRQFTGICYQRVVERLKFLCRKNKIKLVNVIHNRNFYIKKSKTIINDNNDFEIVKNHLENYKGIFSRKQISYELHISESILQYILGTFVRENFITVFQVIDGVRYYRLGDKQSNFRI